MPGSKSLHNFDKNKKKDKNPKFQLNAFAFIKIKKSNHIEIRKKTKTIFF